MREEQKSCGYPGVFNVIPTSESFQIIRPSHVLSTSSCLHVRCCIFQFSSDPWKISDESNHALHGTVTWKQELAESFAWCGWFEGGTASTRMRSKDHRLVQKDEAASAFAEG